MTEYSAACASRLDEIEREASAGLITDSERAQALRFAALAYAGFADNERELRNEAIAESVNIDRAIQLLARASDAGVLSSRHGLAIFALAAITSSTLEPLRRASGVPMH